MHLPQIYHPLQTIQAKSRLSWLFKVYEWKPTPVGWHSEHLHPYSIQPFCKHLQPRCLHHVCPLPTRAIHPGLEVFGIWSLTYILLRILRLVTFLIFLKRLSSLRFSSREQFNYKGLPTQATYKYMSVGPEFNQWIYTRPKSILAECCTLDAKFSQGPFAKEVSYVEWAFLL